MKDGVTLIELVISLALTVIGSVTLIHMMSIGIFADSNLEQSVVALNLANEKMEEVKDMAFAGISSQSETGSAIGFDFVDNRVLTVTNTAAGLKDVRVEVQWSPKNTQQSVAIETYMADY